MPSRLPWPLGLLCHVHRAGRPQSGRWSEEVGGAEQCESLAGPPPVPSMARSRAAGSGPAYTFEPGLAYSICSQQRRTLATGTLVTGHWSGDACCSGLFWFSFGNILYSLEPYLLCCVVNTPALGICLCGPITAEGNGAAADGPRGLIRGGSAQPRPPARRWGQACVRATLLLHDVGDRGSPPGTEVWAPLQQ